MVELETLGPVDRAQHDRVRAGAAGVAVERQVCEQVAEDRALAALVVGAGEVDEGAQVAQPAPGPGAGRPASPAAGRAAQAVGLAGGDEDGDDLVAKASGSGVELARGGQERPAQVAQRARLACREARNRGVNTVVEQRLPGVVVGVGEQGAASASRIPARSANAAAPTTTTGTPAARSACSTGASWAFIRASTARVWPRGPARAQAVIRPVSSAPSAQRTTATCPACSPVVHRSMPRGEGRSRARRLAAARIAPVERWFRPRLIRWVSGKSAASAPKFAAAVALR